MLKKLTIIAILIAPLLGCKKESKFYLSDVDGKTWVAEEDVSYYIGQVNYGPFTNTSNESTDPIYWEIDNMTFTSSDDEYKNYGSAEIEFKRTQGSVTTNEVNKIEYWRWSDNAVYYLDGNRNKPAEAIGEIQFGDDNSLVIKVIEISNKKLEVIFIGNQVTDDEKVHQSPILKFKKD